MDCDVGSAHIKHIGKTQYGFLDAPQGIMTLRNPTRYDLCGCQNEQRLFPFAEITDWFL